MTQIPLQLWLGSCSFLGLTLEAPWDYFISHKWLLFINVRDFTRFNILSMMQRGRNTTHKLRSQCQMHPFISICILKPVSRNLKSHLELSLKRKKDLFHLLLVVAPDGSSVNAASVCRAMTPSTTQHVHIKCFVRPNRTKFDAAVLLVVNNKPAKCEAEWMTVSRDSNRRQTERDFLL